MAVGSECRPKKSVVQFICAADFLLPEENLCETAETAVNKQWEKDKNIYNESAKNTGDAIGAEMVERYNKTLQKSQEKLLKKIENNKKIALAKAAALLGKNKTKIASMTGIYIP